MKKILVPCDFSTPAQEAFKFAVRIAQQSKGEIHVLYIIDTTFLHGNPSLSHSYAFNVSFLKEMEVEAEAKFRKMWERYSPLTLPVKFKHSIGSLVEDVEGYVRANEIDVIIMGTHGDSQARWGTNTEKIVRHSPVPLLAIRKEPDTDVKNIVVPIIPDQFDKDFYDKLKQLQRFFNASLQLLWINTPRIFKNDSEAQADLQKFATQAGLTNYSIHVRSDYDVEEGIYRFARDNDSDMIAMGTHAWKGLVHFLNGSIAEDIVNHISVPVWTYAMK
ncbi:MAG TPA: universal stress protein [Chryseosolibacter sp.]